MVHTAIYLTAIAWVPASLTLELLLVPIGALVRMNTRRYMFARLHFAR